MNEWLDKWNNEWITKWIYEWMNEYMNEWIIGWLQMLFWMVVLERIDVINWMIEPYSACDSCLFMIHKLSDI